MGRPQRPPADQRLTGPVEYFSRFLLNASLPPNFLCMSSRAVFWLCAPMPPSPRGKKGRNTIQARGEMSHIAQMTAHLRGYRTFRDTSCRGLATAWVGAVAKATRYPCWLPFVNPCAAQPHEPICRLLGGN